MKDIFFPQNRFGVKQSRFFDFSVHAILTDLPKGGGGGGWGLLP